MNKILLILLLILSNFSSYKLMAEMNPFEYRGVKLDMSLNDISKLESVSEGYMPNPKTDIKCSNAIFYYDTFKKKSYVTNKLPKENTIFKEADDIYFCGDIYEFERNRNNFYLNNRKRFRLKGDALIYNHDVEYKFYKNKLYHLTVNYGYQDSVRYPNKVSHSEFLKNTVSKIEKKFQNSKYLGDSFTSDEKRLGFGHHTNTKVHFFVSKSNMNILLVLSANYNQNKKFGLKTSKTYKSINLWLYNRQIDNMIDKKGDKVLANKIKIYKEKQILRENKIKNLKKKKERLDKKYNY